jgi:hypothetical protein
VGCLRIPPSLRATLSPGLDCPLCGLCVHAALPFKSERLRSRASCNLRLTFTVDIRLCLVAKRRVAQSCTPANPWASTEFRPPILCGRFRTSQIRNDLSQMTPNGGAPGLLCSEIDCFNQRDQVRIKESRDESDVPRFVDEPRCGQVPDMPFLSIGVSKVFTALI